MSKLRREEIESNSYRVRVPWGWLFIEYQDVYIDRGNGMECGWEWRPAICFVFDPFHWWKIKEIKK